MTYFTLAKEISVSGVGLHTGAAVTVVLRPSHRVGIQLIRKGQPVLLGAKHVFNTALCTEVGTPGQSIQTIEHLFAALHAYRVTNIDIEVDGGEIPILDGSALPWVEALEAAGLVPCTGAVPAVLQPHTQDIQLKHGVARVIQAEDLTLAIDFSYPVPGMDNMQAQYKITPEVFKREIAPARTFCRLEDVENMRAAGLIQGGSLDCACVFKPDGTTENPAGLRFLDEPVRHKLLDLLGDLYIQGQAITGHIFVPQAGHSINNNVLRTIC